MTKYSTSSLRRDLVDLEEKGLIQRAFGKIKLLNQENLEFTWGYRENNNLIAKEKICKIASSFIDDNDAIFMDPSTTTINILNYVKNISGLKIITNSLKAAEIIQTMPEVSGFLSGGIEAPISSGYRNRC